MMDENVECLDCGWQGYDTELVSKTDDANDKKFIYCPSCGSDDIQDIDDEEEK